MKLNDPDAYITATEAEVLERLLPLEGARVLELGCGRAWMTRMLVERFGAAEVVATEVDRVQLEKNLQMTDLPNVTFVYGGAESIDAEDGSFDVVVMFKSLHHVPVALMDAALAEIGRVLRPGGMAWFSEPVYWGPFNDILRLFHDEKRVRQAAFEALQRVVESGRMDLVEEVFFQVPGHYPDWEDFERRFIHVTHTQHALDDALYQRVKQAFERHMTNDGVHLLKPHRGDLLRRPV